MFSSRPSQCSMAGFNTSRAHNSVASKDLNVYFCCCTEEACLSHFYSSNKAGDKAAADGRCRI